VPNAPAPAPATSSRDSASSAPATGAAADPPGTPSSTTTQSSTTTESSTTASSGATPPSTTPPSSTPLTPTGSGSLTSPISRTASPSPTFFSPTNPSSFSLAGPIEVNQARQDPFSNLLLRGALHEQVVTLDVVGTPDYPVRYGVPGTVLFGTCKCSLRGQGLQLTVEDGSTVLDGGAGRVRLRGSYRVALTGSDALTLSRP